MNTFDWTIITLYLLGLIVTSLYLSRGQSNTEEYFLGGRNIPWLAIGLSTMATQLGAVSFISAPAFVALSKEGGLIWLGYEFAGTDRIDLRHDFHTAVSPSNPCRQHI